MGKRDRTMQFISLICIAGLVLYYVYSLPSGEPDYIRNSQLLKNKYNSTRQSWKTPSSKAKAGSNTYIPHTPNNKNSVVVPELIEWVPKFDAAHLRRLHDPPEVINEYNSFNCKLEDWFFSIVAYHHDILIPEVLVQTRALDSPIFSYVVYKPPFLENSLNTGNKSCILMLVRNMELEGALETIRKLEDRFNKYHKYDWVFLNDEPFTTNFIVKTSAMCSSSRIKYGMIPKEQWSEIPVHINQTHMEEQMIRMEDDGVLYGGSLSYRHMCRFQSMFFYKHQAMLEYKYYMRTEPDVEYFCDFNYMDPFKALEVGNKKYGFILSLYEYENTIPSLWTNITKYIEQEIPFGDLPNGFSFLIDGNGEENDDGDNNNNETYNHCHFWSNFEVADMDEFFRTSEYNKLMEYLNMNNTGFYYERWGDAPVHSIAAMLFLSKEDIIHFDTLGYYHAPFGSCPLSEYIRMDNKCLCNPRDEAILDIKQYSCLTKWWQRGDGKRFLY